MNTVLSGAIGMTLESTLMEEHGGVEPYIDMRIESLSLGSALPPFLNIDGPTHYNVDAPPEILLRSTQEEL